MFLLLQLWYWGKFSVACSLWRTRTPEGLSPPPSSGCGVVWCGVRRRLGALKNRQPRGEVQVLRELVFPARPTYHFLPWAKHVQNLHFHPHLPEHLPVHITHLTNCPQSLAASSKPKCSRVPHRLLLPPPCPPQRVPHCPHSTSAWGPL